MEQHYPYQTMYTLSQDYEINDEKQMISDFKKMKENKIYRYAERGDLTQAQMFQAIENK